MKGRKTFYKKPASSKLGLWLYSKFFSPGAMSATNTSFLVGMLACGHAVLFSCFLTLHFAGMVQINPSTGNERTIRLHGVVSMEPEMPKLNFKRLMVELLDWILGAWKEKHVVDLGVVCSFWTLFGMLLMVYCVRNLEHWYDELDSVVPILRCDEKVPTRQQPVKLSVVEQRAAETEFAVCNIYIFIFRIFAFYSIFLATCRSDSFLVAPILPSFFGFSYFAFFFSSIYFAGYLCKDDGQLVNNTFESSQQHISLMTPWS